MRIFTVTRTGSRGRSDAELRYAGDRVRLLDAAGLEACFGIPVDEHPAQCLDLNEDQKLSHGVSRPRLRALAAERWFDMLQISRLALGSRMIEGYNLNVWQPVN